MIQPNNLRNRWRRMFQTQRSYGWRGTPFREWVLYGILNPTSYSVQSGNADESVVLIRSTPKSHIDFFKSSQDLRRALRESLRGVLGPSPEELEARSIGDREEYLAGL